MTNFNSYKQCIMEYAFYLVYVSFAKENYEIYENVPPTYEYEPPKVEVVLDKVAQVDTVITIDVINNNGTTGKLWCVYIRMYVGMHVCMYVCMYVCMHAYMHACILKNDITKCIIHGN